MNASSRRLDNPDGTRPLTWPVHRNLVQADRTEVLCLLLAVNKGFFTIENPLGSLLFCSAPSSTLQQVVPCNRVVLDQCQFGLRPVSPLPSEFLRKSTILFSHSAAFSGLAKRCPGTSISHTRLRTAADRRSGRGPHSIRCHVGWSLSARAVRSPCSVCVGRATCHREADGTYSGLDYPEDLFVHSGGHRLRAA